MATREPKCQQSLKNGMKVLVIGQDKVGKTTMIKKLIEILTNAFSCGVETFSFVEASLYDTPSVRKLTIRTASVFILTYAADNDESFDFVTTLIDEVRRIKGKHAPIIVAANKSDKDVPVQNRIFADCIITIDYECEHFEVCSHDGKNLDNIIKLLLGFYNMFLMFPDEQENGQKEEDCKTSLCRFLCI